MRNREWRKVLYVLIGAVLILDTLDMTWDTPAYAMARSSTLTNNQLGNLFNVSGADLTALKNRLATKASQWTSLVAAAGE